MENHGAMGGRSWFRIHGAEGRITPDFPAGVRVIARSSSSAGGGVSASSSSIQAVFLDEDGNVRFRVYESKSDRGDASSRSSVHGEFFQGR